MSIQVRCFYLISGVTLIAQLKPAQVRIDYLDFIEVIKPKGLFVKNIQSDGSGTLEVNNIPHFSADPTTMDKISLPKILILRQYTPAEEVAKLYLNALPTDNGSPANNN